MKKQVSYRTKFQDLPIAIETGKGQYRHWYDPHSGEKGRTLMKHPYGYVENTLGLDGDEVDVFLGPYKDSNRVYVVTQMKRFEFEDVDEQKVMLGFNNSIEAKTAYLEHFNDARFFGFMQEMTLDEFRQKLSSKYGKLIKSKSRMFPLLPEEYSDKIRFDNMFYLNQDNISKSEKSEESVANNDDAVKSLQDTQATLMKVKSVVEESEDKTSGNTDFSETKKSLGSDEVFKALKAAAIAGLSKRERLNAAYQAGMVMGRQNPKLKEEPVQLNQDELNVGTDVRRPLHEPPAVPVRRVETPWEIEPQECGDVTYRSPSPEDQEAGPYWRRG